MKDKTNAEKVREFMTSMGQDVDQPLTTHRLDFRKTLIKEEADEVKLAFDELIWADVWDDAARVDQKADLLKELCDVLYVVYGAAVTFGWDIDTAFNRVHKSNMSKLGDDGKPVYRKDGKVIKGPNYKKPNLKDLV